MTYRNLTLTQPISNPIHVGANRRKGVGGNVVVKNLVVFVMGNVDVVEGVK